MPQTVTIISQFSVDNQMHISGKELPDSDFQDCISFVITGQI